MTVGKAIELGGKTAGNALPTALRPMTAGQFEASLQTGLEQLQRGQYLDEDTMAREFERMLTKPPPAGE